MRRYEDGGVMMLTPELAMEWLTRFRYERQRPLKVKLRNRHARHIRRGTFRRSTITFHSVNGQLVMTNGQHRCAAVIETGEAIEVQRQFIHCDSWDEVHEDYGMFDVPGSIRSDKEVWVSRGMTGHLGLSITNMRAVKAAMPVLFTGFSTENTAGHDLAGDANAVADAALEWKDEAARLFEALQRRHREMPPTMLRNRAVIATGLVLMRHKTEEAFRFFESLALRNQSQGEAPYELALVLQGRRFMGQKKILELSRVVARAWNAFLKDAKPNLRPRPVEWESPILLEGTPYDGRHVVYYTPRGWETSGVNAPPTTTGVPPVLPLPQPTPANVPEDYAERFQTWRLNNQFSRETAAALIGVSARLYGAWESGEYRPWRSAWAKFLEVEQPSPPPPDPNTLPRESAAAAPSHPSGQEGSPQDDGVPADYAGQISAWITTVGVTRRELGELFGVDPSAFYNWAHGRNAPSQQSWARFLELRSTLSPKPQPFSGLNPMALVVCRDCGKRGRVHEVNGQWPERDLCDRHLKANRALRSGDPAKPWAGIAPDTDVWCDGCDVRMPAGKVRHLWPFPDLCDHCAQEVEPEGVRCERHGIVQCGLPECLPQTEPTCEECGTLLPDRTTVLCHACTAREVDEAVADYKRHVLHIADNGMASAINGKALTEEAPYIHVKGPNPLTKKRPGGSIGSENSRQSKRERLSKGRAR